MPGVQRLVARMANPVLRLSQDLPVSAAEIPEVVPGVRIEGDRRARRT